MASILSSLENLVASIFDIFRSIFNTVLSALESVSAIFANLVRSIFDLMSGLVGFILGMFSSFFTRVVKVNVKLKPCFSGNIVIIGILIAAFVGYSAYRQKHQGGGIAAGKKRA